MVTVLHGQTMAKRWAVEAEGLAFEFHHTIEPLRTLHAGRGSSALGEDKAIAQDDCTLCGFKEVFR